MARLSRIFLYRYDRIAGRTLHISVNVMIVLALLCGLEEVLAQWGFCFDQLDSWPVILLIYEYAWYICGILAAACVLSRMIISPFVKSEEEEEFERKVDYILLQKAREKAAEEAEEADLATSPLRDLSAEQERQIEQLLRDLPAHDKKTDHINLALVAQYMTALEKLGKADLKDKKNLRLWVARITGKQVPSSSQFNEAVPSTAATKVNAARKELEKLLR